MSDELEARLLAAQRRAWFAAKRAEHPEETRHFEHMLKLKELGPDFRDELFDYAKNLLTPPEPIGPVQ